MRKNLVILFFLIGFCFSQSFAGPKGFGPTSSPPVVCRAKGLDLRFSGVKSEKLEKSLEEWNKKAYETEVPNPKKGNEVERSAAIEAANKAFREGERDHTEALSKVSQDYLAKIKEAAQDLTKLLGDESTTCSWTDNKGFANGLPNVEAKAADSTGFEINCSGRIRCHHSILGDFTTPNAIHITRTAKTINLSSSNTMCDAKINLQSAISQGLKALENFDCIPAIDGDSREDQQFRDALKPANANQ